MKKRFLCAGLAAILGLGAIGLGACSENAKGEEGYSLQITNKADIEEEFSIYDSSRTIEVEITKDGEVQNASSAVATGELTTESSNNDVVLVGGLVLTAVSEGEATVTVSYHGWTDSVNVTVITEPYYEHNWETGKEYFLGIEYNGTDYYATGNTIGTYSYEGEMTISMNKAARVTLTEGDELNEYYMSFVKDEVTYYITIEVVGGYVDLQYETTKSPIYWNGANGIFVNEDRSYFLCYNSTYGCLYASSISSWLGSSPIATLYEIPDVIPADEPLPDPATWTAGSSYLFGVNDGEQIRYITGATKSGYDYEGVLTTNASEAATVTVTAATDETKTYDTASSNAYYLSFGEEASKKYITIETPDEDNVNLAYSSTASALYWCTNEDNVSYWGNEDGTYFLCYNSLYRCLYCSEVASYLTSSPIAALYDNPTETAE
ncbi:MAG: hypothetical protein LUD22_03850 [Coprobacillus sp.]|nr:hypothetical protein [Coprobacillus sp.]